MSSITRELARTRTAAWFLAAREPQAPDWDARVRCFDALAGILAEHAARHEPGQRQSQPPIRVPALLTKVAGRANSSRSSAFQHWQSSTKGRGTGAVAGSGAGAGSGRLAGRGTAPRVAFADEAKTVAFWPYREGALLVADAFDMNLPEVAAAYLRALAAWACDHPQLAACEPAGPPRCVAEDALVLARCHARHAAARADVQAIAARLAELAGHEVGRVLDDLSLTPLGAYNTVRGEVIALLAPPEDPIAPRLRQVIAELTDRLLHQADGDEVLTTADRRVVRAALVTLGAMVAGTRQGPRRAEPGAEGEP